MKALNFEDDKLPQVQISECPRYIKPTDVEWWKANIKLFPDGFIPWRWKVEGGRRVEKAIWKE